MPYQTDERVKSFLDTNQLHREQMCRAILATDKRFSDVRPRHPRGGRDGGRDVQAIYRDDQLAFGAVGFINQANDSDEQKRNISAKFKDDLESALRAENDLKIFVFFTNINFTIGEKDALIEIAKKSGILVCDILDRERIRIVLDSPDGFSIRFQYLNIPLSEEEQASFFSKWGDDIQSVISSGFQKVEGTLNRLLFLQESNDPVSQLGLVFELDRKYHSDEIGHFRLFCYLALKEPKNKIISILFGSFDRSNRMYNMDNGGVDRKSGIEFGIGRGQWEKHINIEDGDVNGDGEWMEVGSGSSIGVREVEFISISYSKDSLIRFFPVISLRDLDDAMFLPFVNKSLAEKIKAIHVYSNGYKLKEIDSSELSIDSTDVESIFPIEFDADEMQDKMGKNQA